jgi:hypothetical protein
MLARGMLRGLLVSVLAVGVVALIPRPASGQT